GDHVLGLPGLLQTMGLNDRTQALDIYGPPGTKRMLRHFTSPPMPRPSFPVHVHEIEDGAVLSMDGYRIEARSLKHTVYNLGYALIEDPRPGRFDKPKALELGVPEGPAFGKLQKGMDVELEDGTVITPGMVLGPQRRGRKVVFTGDCTPCEATIELAHRADVLIHDSTYASDYEDANGHGHSTAQQAAFMAQKAQARHLFLTHISPRYTKADDLFEEATAIFDEVTVAHDLMAEVIKFPPDEPAEGSFAEPEEGVPAPASASQV
ncbi:MAG: MBL fold metallo-hydrolase, partial [Candidatus Thermoplasmatota archaeon]|nr:MBL fold metallo-hydrolase [Candidatus Thermoplasmatota archaeon]